jgi:hypothetical protein
MVRMGQMRHTQNFGVALGKLLLGRQEDGRVTCRWVLWMKIGCEDGRCMKLAPVAGFLVFALLILEFLLLEN